jgi:hypothetical protein
MERRWAKILSIKEKVSLGITDDDKLVLIPRLKETEALQVGDFISFIPQLPRNPFNPNGNNRKVEFFAHNPRIIGHVVEKPEKLAATPVNTPGDLHDAGIHGQRTETIGAASAIATASGA